MWVWWWGRLEVWQWVVTFLALIQDPLPVWHKYFYIKSTSAQLSAYSIMVCAKVYHKDKPQTLKVSLAEQEAYKKQLQDAYDALQADTETSILKAAQNFNIKYGTLQNWIQGNHRAARKAHKKQQLLSEAQEKAIEDWIHFLGFKGYSVSKATIKPKVFEMCGKSPGDKWIAQFLCHHPDCKLRCPSGLDSKHAKTFNYATVKKHFELLDVILKKNSIPWENVYNMDEKGIQIRGGRKQNGWKNIFSCQDHRNTSSEVLTLNLLPSLSVFVHMGLMYLLDLYLQKRLLMKNSLECLGLAGELIELLQDTVKTSTQYDYQFTVLQHLKTVRQMTFCVLNGSTKSLYHMHRHEALVAN